METPKIRIEVKLIGDKSVEFTINDIHHFVLNCFYGRFLTKNEWVFEKGDVFMVNKNMTIIPREIKNRWDTSGVMFNNVCKSSFKNDKERYEFLKGFSIAINELSGSNFYSGIRIFSDTPYIEYRDREWVIY